MTLEGRPRRGRILAATLITIAASCSSTPTDLSVSVVDADGGPIAGAAVTVSAGGEQQSGTTDAAGVVALSDLGHTSAEVSVEASGFFPETLPVTLESGQNEASATLTRIAFDASVVITDADGQPLEGVAVTLGDLESTTDATGTASWSSIPGDSPTVSVTIAAEAEGYLPASVDGTLERGSNGFTLSMELIPIDLALSVVDDAGTGVEGAEVALSGVDGTSRTDAEGTVSWLDLPSLEATLVATAQGYFDTEEMLRLERGPNDVTVLLERDPFGVTTAGACPAAGPPVFIDDFQDGAADGWMADPAWSAEPDPDGDGNVFYRVVWPDEGVAASAQPEGQELLTGDSVIRFRARGDLGFPHLSVEIIRWGPFTDDAGQEMQLDFYRVSVNEQGLVELTRRTVPVEGESSLAELGSAPGPRIEADWMTFEIAVQGTTVDVWIDGVKLLSVEDGTALQPGAVGFSLLGMGNPTPQLIIDDVAFCGLDGPFESAVAGG